MDPSGRCEQGDRRLSRSSESGSWLDRGIDAPSTDRRGTSLHQQEDYEAAIAKTSEALELDEHCLPAYATRAASYWYSEHFVEATEDYSQLLELAPDAAFAYVGRGQVYVELGEYETAMKDLNKPSTWNARPTRKPAWPMR